MREYITASCRSQALWGGLGEQCVVTNSGISWCMLCLPPKFGDVLNSVSNMRLGHPEEMMITR